MIFAELEHTRLRVEAYGRAGYMVLAIPGWLEPLEAYLPLAQSLVQIDAPVRTYLVDLPGTGRSERRTARGYAVTDFADDLWELVDALHCESIILMGHSMGGVIACVMALRRPKQTAGLILIDTQPGGACPDIWPPSLSQSLKLKAALDRLPEAAFPRMLPRLVFQGLVEHQVDHELWPVMRPLIAATPPDAAREALASVLEVNLQPQLEQITAPTLDVLGALDPVMMPAEHDLLLRLPNCSRREIPAAGHVVLLDAPYDLAQVIADFLAGLSASAAA